MSADGPRYHPLLFHAVLVDTFLTVKQNRGLVEWIEKSGKNLTTIYATHGHGDHFFGVNAIRERFPNARFVALPDVITIMRQQVSSGVLDLFWNPRFVGQIDAKPAIAEQLEGTVIALEGQELVTVPLGHTETANTTCLHVPSIGLVAAGDAAYNDVHVYLAESTAHTRKQWISALDTIESLKPSTVVAGHKRPGRADAPASLWRQGNTFATLTGSPPIRERQRTSTTRCSRFILIE